VLIGTNRLFDHIVHKLVSKMRIAAVRDWNGAFDHSLLQKAVES